VEGKLLKKTMTIPEFFEYERNKNNNKRLEKLLIFTVAGIGFLKENVYAATDPMGKVDIAGATFLGILRTIGYWLCLIFCILEILKILMNGQSKDIGKIIIKYLLVFSTLYVLPWMFELIKAIFQ
jgi:hypothetical protein